MCCAGLGAGKDGWMTKSVVGMDMDKGSTCTFGDEELCQAVSSYIVDGVICFL